MNRKNSNSTNTLNVDSSQTLGSMTASDESPHREVRSVTESLLGQKVKLRLGTRNVRTMYEAEASKSAQVIREMERYHLDILDISECRWTGSRRQLTSDGSVILSSGHKDTHKYGVAIVLSRETASTLMEWEPINERLLRARFNSKYCKLTILQRCAPTNYMEEKDDWYDQLFAISKVPQYSWLLVI